MRSIQVVLCHFISVLTRNKSPLFVLFQIVRTLRYMLNYTPFAIIPSTYPTHTQQTPLNKWMLREISYVPASKIIHVLLFVYWFLFFSFSLILIIQQIMKVIWLRYMKRYFVLCCTICVCVCVCFSLLVLPLQTAQIISQTVRLVILINENSIGFLKTHIQFATCAAKIACVTFPIPTISLLERLLLRHACTMHYKKCFSV